MNRLENVISGMRKYYPVSDPTIEIMALHFSEQYLPKNHFLTTPGLRDKYVYFIEKGCARTFFHVGGKEGTNWFSKEGDVTFSSNSLYHQTAGFEYVQLLEDSLIYRLSIEKLNELYRENIEIANWSRVIHQEVLLQMQNLRLDRLSLSAQQRYEKFFLENRDLFSRVNLGYIASYLGMSQPHLSSLRAGIRFKDR